jgi:hypothetical protein
MQIIGKDGQEVELKILGYEFPNETRDEWDSNWLRIYLIVKSNLGSWQTVDSSLTTWEFKQLADWFKDLSENKEVEYSDMTFVEPNLAFELIERGEKTKTIQLRFDYESKPKSADSDKDYFINFQFTNDDLAKIATESRNEYDKFPVRPLLQTQSEVSKDKKEKKPWWQLW